MYQNKMRPDEQVLSALRDLYSAYGYERYQVSKFESYDFYARNKNFLQSRRILTFSDTNGRLMALKPDVTLSIIKHTKPTAACNKVYYTENVYRVPRNADGFQEIMQTGLELIGTVDDYAMAEVVMLAERSLRAISPEYVLDVSHVGVLSGLLASQGLSEAQSAEVMAAAGEKNQHRLRELCTRHGLPERFCATLCALVGLYGPLDAALCEAEALDLPPQSRAALRALRRLSQLLALSGCRGLRLDFSLVNDMDYYNGLVFRGFISGIAAGVLSGGQYDNLLARMGRTQQAIGFAVYLDQLERHFAREDAYDVDVVLTYRPQSDPAILIRTAQALTEEGAVVRVVPEGSGPIRARRRLMLDGTEVREDD